MAVRRVKGAVASKTKAGQPPQRKSKRQLSGGRKLRIRKGRAGDLGWAFSRQAVLYQEEFGYLPVFETYVARGLAPFLEAFDARLDRLWVAELEDRPVGCIAIQHDTERSGWAKLRWYFVEKQGRGRGVGHLLLRKAVSFSRRAGYRGIQLWTVSDLGAARRQYERAGFRIAQEDPSPCPWAPWGHEQRWELAFTAQERGGAN